VQIGDQACCQYIGLRQVALQTPPDADGSGFHFSVNGRPVFMRGANWIPADALPGRITPQRTRELLESAVAANMNMLRIWGGGQYEPTWFYELCDELGICIWQDFMFSCCHYPAADQEWLNLVTIEAQQQVRRLSLHPSVVLWCGDNELVGALNWWQVTLQNRDRYLANYVRLNHTLERVMLEEQPDAPFWPSSPSPGHLNYGDGWKNDAAGDMHFWDVWHEAAAFSAYRTVQPRFCSEFGFQSFPSMPVIETFTEPEDQNVSSEVMNVHQRNVGGNARIVETLIRHFDFPESFSRTVFLSQCQQAMAIRTAVEYWRSIKPRCMGTLYWQLNDTWPVASWSSLEYGGGWKLLHYVARRFYQDVLVALIPSDKLSTTSRGEDSDRSYKEKRIATAADNAFTLRVTNDSPSALSLSIKLETWRMQGDCIAEQTLRVTAPPNEAVSAHHLSLENLPEDVFFVWYWHDELGEHSGSNEFIPKPYRRYKLPEPNIQYEIYERDEAMTIVLSSNKPAFFVTLNLGGHEVFDDNGITLLPGRPRTLTRTKQLENTLVPRLASLQIEHLTGCVSLAR